MKSACILLLEVILIYAGQESKAYVRICMLLIFLNSVAPEDFPFLQIFHSLHCSLRKFFLKENHQQLIKIHENLWENLITLVKRLFTLDLNKIF